MPFTSTKIKMTAAFPGMLVDANDHKTDSYFNQEAASEMPFGIMLKQGTVDNAALIPTTTADKFIGVLRHSSSYNLDNELGLIGLKPKTTLGVLVEGKIYVQVDEAVTPASPVRVRTDTNGGILGSTSGPGTFRTTASAGHTASIASFARFLSTSTGADVVELWIDMSGRNGAVAD